MKFLAFFIHELDSRLVERARRSSEMYGTESCEPRFSKLCGFGGLREYFRIRSASCLCNSLSQIASPI